MYYICIHKKIKTGERKITKYIKTHKETKYNTKESLSMLKR